jgi:hypothetical protein
MKMLKFHLFAIHLCMFLLKYAIDILTCFIEYHIYLRSLSKGYLSLIIC